MHLLLRLALLVGATIYASAASATIVNFDISSQAGFQQNGISGTAGNGTVFLSPVYSFASGSTVDFGTAFLSPDFIDFRSGCQFSNSCFSNYGSAVLFVRNGVGALLTAPFDLNEVPGAQTGIEYCPNFTCPAVPFRLLFTTPSDVDGIQFLFQGSALSIASAIPEPSTWALLLIGFAGIGFVKYRRKLSFS